MAGDAKPHVPRPLAMVLCDSVTRDPTTRKFNILGTFDRVTATQFPAALRVTVYVALTDCRGKQSLQLRLSRLNADEGQEEDLLSVQSEIEARDPLDVVQFAPTFHGAIDRAGVYYLGVWTAMDDKAIDKVIERRFVVVDKSGEKSNVNNP
jgi:hypothetical protein